jgi:two-component system sensor histidine kinase CiaH
MSNFRKATIQLTLTYSLIFFAFIWLFSGGIYLWVNNSLGEGYVNRVNNALEQQHSTVNHQAEISDSTAAVAADITLDRLRNILLAINAVAIFGIPLVAYLISRRTLTPLVESQKSQQQFIANASHELRTPLAVMLAELDWALNKDRNSNDYKTTIINTRQEVEEMSALIRSLLLLARLNGQKLRFTPANLSDVVNQAIMDSQALTRDKDLTIKVRMGDLFASGDANLLTIICNNLFENATKYAPRSTTISITGDTIDDMVRMQISNLTNKLSKSDLPHLFDRFYQAEAHQADKGSGLGLAIVKQIVDAHSGKIEATLHDNIVTFSLLLPEASNQPSQTYTKITEVI